MKLPLLIIFIHLIQVGFCLEKKHFLFLITTAPGDNIPLINLAREASAQGHRVTIAVEDSINEHPLLNASLNFPADRISTGHYLFSIPMDAFGPLLEKYSRSKTSARELTEAVEIIFKPMYAPQYEALDAYLQSNPHPDIIVTHVLGMAGTDIANKYNIPVVLVWPTIAPLGPPIEMPSAGMPIEMSFFQQLYHIYYRMDELYYMLRWFSRLNEERVKKGHYESWLDIVMRTRVVWTTSPGLAFPVQLPPLITMVGPLLADNVQPLPSDIKEWLEQDSEPVVAIIFGTTGNPWKEQLQKLVEGMRGQKYRVLIGLRDLQTEILDIIGTDEKEKSRYLVKGWLPQMAVLGHPNVKVFVSHCGAGSVHEAVWNAKPILALPFMFDQIDNGMRVEEAGLGLVLGDKFTFTSEAVRDKLNRLLNEEQFTKTAVKVSKIMRRLGGAKTAIQICEDEIEFGSEHLQLKGVSFARVWIFLIGVLLLIFYSIIKCCKLVLRHYKQKQE